MKTKLCLILADCPINYCGGLGLRFKKMIPTLEKYYDLKIFTNIPKRTTKNKSHAYNSEVIYIEELNTLQYINKLPFSGLRSQLFNPLGVITKLNEYNWIPDIVLCSDHCTITSGLYISKIFNCKFILEYDLALFSYEKIYDKENLNEKNQIYSNFIANNEMIGCYEADLVIMCSKYYEINCPYKMKNVATVENGIILKDFQKNINYTFPHSNKDDINIIYIGRFNSQKGIEYILNLQLPDNVKLYFIGPERGGNLISQVIKTCDNKKNFFYIGEKKGEEKIGIMKKADAILFPSLHEPFGIVGLEAMASKTICITTRIDGIATYMDKNMCIQIDNLDIQNAIHKFLNMDKKEKDEIIDRAYEKVKNYDWEIITNNMINTINSVL